MWGMNDAIRWAGLVLRIRVGNEFLNKIYEINRCDLQFPEAPVIEPGKMQRTNKSLSS